MTDKELKEIRQKISCPQLGDECYGEWGILTKDQLHQTFGFGKDRIAKTLEAINGLSAERDKDEVFWTHIDRTLEQLGLNFNPEDYEEMDI
jgi:hypothetical protein